MSRALTLIMASIAMGVAGCGGATPSSSTSPSSAVDLTSSTTTQATVAEPATSTEPETTMPGGSYCNESVPPLIALDINSGEPVWRFCDQPARSLYVLGRAPGATIVMEQADGTGTQQMLAVDDHGTELWRRPMSDLPKLFIIDSVVVTFEGDVVGVDATTGDELWRHPLTDGTPVAVGKGLVVEIFGGPYPGTGPGTGPADAGLAMLRAVDARSGTQAWVRDVQVVPLSPPNQYSPTAGSDVIAIPTGSGNRTLVVDLVLGSDLLELDGVVQAFGDVLLEIDQSTMTIAATMDVTGQQLTTGVPGYPVPLVPDTEHPMSGTTVTTLRPAPNGNTQVYDLVDMATGTTRWSLEEMIPLARSADLVLATTGSSVQLRDAPTGTLRWEYTAPGERVYIMNGVLGNDIVVVAPAVGGD